MEKLERQIAMETAAGRQMLAVWSQTLDKMSSERRLLKALELTETARRVMRDGIRHQHPDASEEQIQAIYVDRMLSFHGTSLGEIRRLQAQQRGRS